MLGVGTGHAAEAKSSALHACPEPRRGGQEDVADGHVMKEPQRRGRTHRASLRRSHHHSLNFHADVFSGSEPLGGAALVDRDFQEPRAADQRKGRSRRNLTER